MSIKIPINQRCQFSQRRDKQFSCLPHLTRFKMTIAKSPQKDKKKTEAKDEVYLEERIVIPDDGGDAGLFSWKKLWLFSGPGWLSNFFIYS